MRYQEAAVFETLAHIKVFLDDNDATLAAVNHSGARRRLDETLAKLSAHSVDQLAGHRISQGETARLRQLRESIRFEYMRPIAMIAGEQLRKHPDFGSLRMPRWKSSIQTLVVAARDMAGAAEKQAELFIEEGLAPDFVAQLRGAADRLEQSITERGAGRAQRAGATAGLKSETRRARVLIRLLDSLIRPKLATNETLLREWDMAKHVTRRRKSSDTSTSVAVSPESAPKPALAVVPITTSAPTSVAQSVS